jgi:uncharacterized protein (TIGR02001 family)
MPAAFAEGRWGGSAGFTSDYVAYGISQTRGEEAVQADIHYRQRLNDGRMDLFAGAWASSLQTTRRNNARAELNFYAGARWRLGTQSSFALSTRHYEYLGQTTQPRYEYDELVATWAYSDRLFLTTAWSPNMRNYNSAYYTARCCRSMSYEIEAHQPWIWGTALSAGLGYADLTRTSGYVFWNGGIARMLGDVRLDLSYIGTDSRGVDFFGDTVAGSRWAASVLWSFGEH